MKTKVIISKMIVLVLLSVLGISCSNQVASQDVNTAATSSQDNQDEKKKLIKIALLIDTSNSMDGLIDQAKSQLWRLVNELSKAECDNVKADLQIALYEYGNDGLPASEGHIRQVSPFTDDLDKISADLFALTTNGGNEFCGKVIQTSLTQLEWNESGKDLQIIFIAGNEPFTQGPVGFKDACEQAKNQNVVVNTIFCGGFDEGIRTSWKDGAVLTAGEYMSINHNSKTVYVKTPYDDQISKLNSDLNNTYIYYGAKGRSYKMNQVAQDNNAAQISQENMVSRVVTKSKHVYKNKKWDIVDAADDKGFSVDSIRKDDLPEEMKEMTDVEKKQYVESKKKEREQVKTEIAELAQKREEYIAKEKVKMSETAGMLDDEMLKAIQKQASSKSFVFK